MLNLYPLLSQNGHPNVIYYIERVFSEIKKNAIVGTDEQQHIKDRFESLEKRHRNFIRKLCWFYVHGDEDYFRQLLQEAYVVIYDRLPQLHADASWLQERRWVFWRCREAHTLFNRTWASRCLPLGGAMADSLGNDTSDEQHSETVDDLSVCLSERQKRLLDLYREGKSEEEIAAELHIKPASVRKAFRRMAEKMKEYNEQINHRL